MSRLVYYTTFFNKGDKTVLSKDLKIHIRKKEYVIIPNGTEVVIIGVDNTMHGGHTPYDLLIGEFEVHNIPEYYLI